MRKSVCRIPNLLDEQVADEMSTTKEVIANLRGLYENTTNEKLTSVEDYKTKLVEFKNRMEEEHKGKLEKILNCSSSKAVSTAIRLLRNEFSPSEIVELQEYIAGLFTEYVDIFATQDLEMVNWIAQEKANNHAVSRKDIILKIGREKIIRALIDGVYEEAQSYDILDRVVSSKNDVLNTLIYLATDQITKRENIRFPKKKAEFTVTFSSKDNLSATYEMEESVKEGWMQETDKESPFQRVGDEVRSYLSRRVQYEAKMQSTKDGLELVPILTTNGFSKYFNASELHAKLATMLSTCRDVKHMMQILQREGENDVNIALMYEDLLQDVHMRDAFFKDFHNTNVEYTKGYESKYGSKRGIFFQRITSWATSTTFKRFTRNLEKEGLTDTIFKYNEGGVIVINGGIWAQFKNYVTDHIKEGDYYSVSPLDISVFAPDTSQYIDEYDKGFSEVKNVIEGIASFLGIKTTDQSVADLITNKVALKSFLSDAYYIARNETRAGEGTPVLGTGSSQIIKDRIQSMVNQLNSAGNNRTRSVRIDKATYFSDVITCKMSTTIDVIRSFANDAKYIMSLDNVNQRDKELGILADKIHKWIEDNYGCSSEYWFSHKAGIDALGNPIIEKIFYNDWINELYKVNAESLKDFNSFIYHFTYDRAMLFDKVLAEDFSEEYDLKTFIANYFSMSYDAHRGYARYPVFTTGDSLALKFITARKYDYNTIIKKFRMVARQEIARMQLERNVEDHLQTLNPDISLGKITTLANKTDEECSGTFKYLQFLNNEEYKKRIREVLNKRVDETLTAEEQAKESKKNVEELNSVLEDIISEELFKEFKEEFYNKVKDTDLFRNVDPNNDAVFDRMPNIYSLNPAMVEENNAANGLLLYYINTKYAYIQQYQFLGANPAPYGLSTAMQKRYKAYNAPGNTMNIYEVDAQGNFFGRVSADGKTILPERCLYFKDNKLNAENTDPEFMKVLEEMWGKDDPRYKLYLENDATDGQGFRTLESYRRVMGMSHQWTNDPTLEAAYNTIMNCQQESRLRAARELFGKDVKLEDLTPEQKREAFRKSYFTTEQMSTVFEAGAVFQPIKPHTSTVEKVETETGDVLLVPVEHKYAEVFLIPEIFEEGSFRRDLAIEMELNAIDLACSDQCVKVGCFGSADFTNSDNTTLSDDFSKGYVHEISYEDYTIQTNVPVHINALQLFGTQLRKHVFDAIDLEGSYEFFGHTFTDGKEFIRFYNALICENMGNDLVNLADKVGNLTKLSDKLSALKERDVNATMEDLIRFALTTDESDFINPLSEPSASFDNEASFTSEFKKNVNKQRINGGSCVQVSDFGLSGYKNGGSPLRVHTNGKNITYVDTAMTFDFSYEDAAGNPVSLDYCDYIDPRTGKPLGIDGKPLAVDEEIAEPQEGVKGKDFFGWNTKLGVEFPGIYEVVFYRIPTEREYSMINGVTKRFFPKFMGGIVSVPSQYTTVAGFDFDIDKLYYFRKAFKAAPLSKNRVSEVWSKIYQLTKENGKVTGGNEIYRKLKEAKLKAIEDYDKGNSNDEVIASSSNSKSLTIGDLAPELAAFLYEPMKDSNKETPVNEEEEVNEEENINPRRKNLYEFWEEAGLVEEEGKTASEYFAECVSQHKTEFLDFETYNYEKPASENTVTARNNELIKCIQSRLMDPATFNARYTPGGFTNAKHDANILKAIIFRDALPSEVVEKVIGKSTIATLADAERFVKLCEETKEYKDILDILDPDRDVTNVLTTATYNARNRIASKVIGIMANHNTNAVYSKTMEAFTLRTPVAMFGHRTSNLNSSDIEGRDYMLTLAELLASSVDAVKTPVLNFLNINSHTANTAALLGRLGYSTEEIGLFLSQPIIKEVCEYASNNNVRLSRAISKIAENHKIDLKGEYNPDGLLKENLFSGIVNPMVEKDGRQANVLKAFQTISVQAQALSDFIGKTKYTAANSIDNSIGGLIALIYENEAVVEGQSKIGEHLVMSFSNFDSKETLEAQNTLESPIKTEKVTLQEIGDYGYAASELTLDAMQTEEYKATLAHTPFAFEQMMHDAIIAYIKEVCKYFPYQTEEYKKMYHSIYLNVINGNLDQDIIDTINRQYPVFVLHLKSGIGSQFNPDAESLGDNVNKDYYTVDFPQQLEELLSKRELLKLTNEEQQEEIYKALQEEYSFLANTSLEGFIDNALLDDLLIDSYDVSSDNMIDAVTKRYTLGLRNNSQFDKDSRNIYTAAWETLIDDSSKQVDDSRNSLAHALFMYNFFTRGYEVGNNAFINIVPTLVKETLVVKKGVDETTNTTYNEFYRKLARGDYNVTSSLNNFMELFYANNSSNYKLIEQFWNVDRNLNNLTSVGFPGGNSTNVRMNADGSVEISIKMDKYSKFTDLTLTDPKRKLSSGKNTTPLRAYKPAFRLMTPDGPRLFVLQGTNREGSEMLNPMYNVRSAETTLVYKEVPIKGVEKKSVDYTPSEVDYSRNDPNRDNGADSVEGRPEGVDYLVEPIPEADNEAAVIGEAEELKERCKINKTKNGAC